MGRPAKYSCDEERDAARRESRRLSKDKHRVENNEKQAALARERREAERSGIEWIPPSKRKPPVPKVPRAEREKARRHEKAIAAGREPGKAGNPNKYATDEERLYAIREAKRKWREENRAIDNERQARRLREKRAAKAIAEGRTPGKTGNYRKFTPEEIAEKHRTYLKQHYRKNKEVYFSYGRTRRARKRNADGTHTAADISALWDLQKGKCVFCLKPMVKGKFHVDHFVPLIKGGSNDRGNLRLMHKKCNLKKGRADPLEYAARNGMLCF
jgi:5-methylcytosine-specific restriction endonuclease McrA